MANVLSIVVGAVYWIVMVIALLIVFGVDVQNLLISVGTLLVALSFILGNVARLVFESILLILVGTPAD